MGCFARSAIKVAPYALTIAAMSAQTPAFTNVAKGDVSGQQETKQVIVRTAAEWKALWKDHASTDKLPNIDFTKDMVVGIFLGSKPSAGHEVEITGVRPQEKELVVEYVQKQPGRGTMAAQILTEPYHLVAVPKHAGTVRFIHVPGK
jgi:PrcB C-terminal